MSYLRRVALVSCLAVTSGLLAGVVSAAAGPEPTADPDVWAAVSAADQPVEQTTHTCGIRTDDSLWCWGLNTQGQLGVGDLHTHYLPTRVGANTDWTQVSAGWSTSCATKADGTLWCWGLGYSNTPSQVGSATTWSSVSVGDGFRCAIMTDHTLWCWGANAGGQLGLGDFVDRPVPTQVGGAADWADVSTGHTHTCAVRAANTLWCWGTGPAGQLGLGPDDTVTGVPTQVGTNTQWTSVDVSTSTSCAVRLHHSGWCWGANAHGQLGTGDSVARFVPGEVVSAETWKQITTGTQHTCGVRTDGTLWCWGDNSAGQLGVGSGTRSSDFPVQVGRAKTWTMPNAGSEDGCSVQSDSSLWCWGNPDDGELGVGNRTKNSDRPIQVGLENLPGTVVDKLADVSADSASDVWAVGLSRRNHKTSSLVEHWDGSVWTAVPSANPGNPSTVLSGVSALSPTDVWAVGTFVQDGHDRSLIEHWDGSGWTHIPSPNATAFNNELISVHAISATDVWAVGQSSSNELEYVDDGLIEHWDGTSWTVVPAAPHSNWAEQQFTAVTATSPTDVWAVGYGFIDEEAGDLTLTEHWNGSVWTEVKTNHRNRFADHYLRAVSALSSADVWTVGDELVSFDKHASLSEHWNGHAWVKLKNTPSLGDSRLFGLSAQAADDVWTVGTSTNGTRLRTFVLHWDGSAWTQVSAPSPGGKHGTTLTAVSTNAGDDAWAVGFKGSGIKVQSVIEHWDGSTWTVSPPAQ